MSADAATPGRLTALDQFRGYTVLGMFFVNFAARFESIPAVFKHHNTYCSYADLIMPQFFLAAGFALRLTFQRRTAANGRLSATRHVVRRGLTLLFLGVVVHHFDGGAKTWEAFCDLTPWSFLGTACKRNVFQTLVHIAVTSLWILPVLSARPSFRIAWAALSGGAHLGLSYGIGGWSNYVWVHDDPTGIDGGPLGFLTWTIPMVAGTVVCDWLAPEGKATVDTLPSVGRLTAWGGVLALVGCILDGIHLPPLGMGPVYFRGLAVPVFYRAQEIQPSILTMSQRAGSVSYLAFATGCALLCLAVFVLLYHVTGWEVGFLRTLGVNALAGYLIHDMVYAFLAPYSPRDAPLWFGLTACLVFQVICYCFLLFLERRKLFLRL